MCVVRTLIDSSPVLDESRGLSLLDETQHESLLKCLMCWQRQYGPSQVPHTHTHTPVRRADSMQLNQVPSSLFTLTLILMFICC